MKFGIVIAAAMLALGTPAPAQPRPVADKARVALTPGGGLANGVYRAAIVIDLAPDTITYWRNPGEAGVPPAFDWTGSTNVAKVEVAMPAPERISRPAATYSDIARASPPSRPSRRRMPANPSSSP